MFDVITIGDATFDTFLVLDDDAASVQIDTQAKLLCLHYAEKTCIQESAQSVGGNAANVAAGLTKLGRKTAIVTELGDDINGHLIFDELKEAGVDMSLAKVLKEKESRYSIVLNYKSERTVLSSHVPRSYSLPELPQSKYIYYTSLGAGFEKLQRQLLKHLKNNPETKLVFNPGSYQMSSGLKTLRALLPKIDLLFVNREEAAKLLGKNYPVAQCISQLHKKGVGLVAMTDGSEGSFASDGKQLLHMPIYPIEPLAKTGAGDAFASGFLAAHVRGNSLGMSLQWGTANAAGVIQQFGAHKGLMTKRNIEQTIKHHKRISPTEIKMA